MEHLARVELIQQVGQCFVCDPARIRHIAQVGGDVVTGAIRLIACLRKRQDVAEERRVYDGDGAQGFQIAGARRLEMNEAPGLLRSNLIDAELVGTGVQAEFVWPERAGDGGMAREIGCELGEVAAQPCRGNVIHAFLEAPDVARREADPANAQPPQLAGDEEMLAVRGRRFRFIHRHFEFPRSCAHASPDVARHGRGVRYGFAVLHRRARNVFFAHFQRQAFDGLPVRRVGFQQLVGRGFEVAPGERIEVCAQCGPVVTVRLGVYVRAGVNGEEGKAGGTAPVGVLRGLEVVGVRADRLAPAALEAAPRRIGHHFLGRVPGAGHLADGLLGEDHGDAADGLRRLHVPRRRQPQPVATPGRGAQPQRARFQPGQGRAQRGGMFVRGFKNREPTGVGLFERACETLGQRVPFVNQDAQHFSAVRAPQEEGPAFVVVRPIRDKGPRPATTEVVPKDVRCP